MIGTTPINNHPKKAWKASVKIQETHLSSKRNKPLQNFQQTINLKKMNSRRRGRIGRGEEIFEVLSISSLPIGYI